VATTKVSVGLPVYNGAKYVTQALDSLLNQDFDGFDVILCDNASTDETGEICRAYASRDRRIRYYRNETNIGAAPNFRRVFELAQGEFFKWFTHDDICLPAFLSRCYATLKAAPPDVALVYPLCEFIGDFGEPLPSLYCDRIASQSDRPYRRLARVVGRVSMGGPFWGVMRPSYLRRADLGGSVSYWDDLLLAELSLLGKIQEIPEVLFQVRCHSGNAVAVASQEQGTAVVENPSKANRKTRRALNAWMNPGSANRTIWLPIEEERCWEYLKRVHHVPLPAIEKAICYCTVPAVSYWRRFRKIGGAWKRSLRAWASRLRWSQRGSTTMPS
jgi:glycosyltransferase involved in cell wall biosynthesis